MRRALGRPGHALCRMPLSHRRHHIRMKSGRRGNPAVVAGVCGR